MNSIEEDMGVGVNIHSSFQLENLGQSSGVVKVSMTQEDFFDGP
jgi:hypothetical protein